MNSSRKRNFARCLSSELDPEGRYADTTESLPKSAQEPSLRVEFAAAEAAGHAPGFRARVQRDAAVALFRRAAIVVAAIPPGNEGEAREVGFLRLYFLQTYDVCALTREPARKALGERRTDAVEVERDNA